MCASVCMCMGGVCLRVHECRYKCGLCKCVCKGVGVSVHVGVHLCVHKHGYDYGLCECAYVCTRV